MKKDITQKISKLFALAESPNEAEATAALLKARSLMAKNKLSEGSFEYKNDEVIRYDTGISCSKRKNFFIAHLATMIAKYHCCKVTISHEKGKQTCVIAIFGFENDVVAVNSIIKYSLKFILHRIEEIKKQSQHDNKKDAANSYALGFIAGLQRFYEQQNQGHQEWGLVLVVPQEVHNATSRFGRNSFIAKMNIDQIQFSQGEVEGYEFGKTKQIENK